MDSGHVNGRRQVAHGLALSVVLLGTLAYYVASRQGTASAMNQSPPRDALAAVESTAPSAAVPDPNPAHTLRHSGFAPSVERWRSMSREATWTAQQATGVSLDEDILLALVAVESGGKPAARSPRGAVGLVQVEPATFEELRSRYHQLLAGQSLEQPHVNLLAGALYVADCTRVLGADLADPDDLALVLHAYNIGPRAVAEWRDNGSWLDQTERGAQLEDGLPPETVEYASRIMVAINSARI